MRQPRAGVNTGLSARTCAVRRWSPTTGLRRSCKGLELSHWSDACIRTTRFSRTRARAHLRIVHEAGIPHASKQLLWTHDLRRTPLCCFSRSGDWAEAVHSDRAAVTRSMDQGTAAGSAPVRTREPCRHGRCSSRREGSSPISENLAADLNSGVGGARRLGFVRACTRSHDKHPAGEHVATERRLGLWARPIGTLACVGH
jgi:hypothetical protein